MRAFNSLGLLAVLCSVGGCGASSVASSSGVSVKPASVFFAFDTSDSAGLMKEEFARGIRDQLMSVPTDTACWVFTFDSDAHEIPGDGKAPGSQEEAAVIVKRAMKRKSGTKGTNMARLVSLLDNRANDTRAPVELRIYTDCGIELLNDSEKEIIRQTTASWDTDPRIASVHILGLRDGMVEAVSDLFRMRRNEKLFFSAGH